MRQYQSKSTVRPPNVDTTSKTITYVNTNIKAVTHTDEISSKAINLFTYDVTEYTKLEYSNKIIAELVTRQSASEDALLALMDGGAV